MSGLPQYGLSKTSFSGKVKVEDNQPNETLRRTNNGPPTLRTTTVNPIQRFNHNDQRYNRQRPPAFYSIHGQPPSGSSGYSSSLPNSRPSSAAAGPSRPMQQQRPPKRSFERTQDSGWGSKRPRVEVHPQGSSGPPPPLPVNRFATSSQHRHSFQQQRPAQTFGTGYDATFPTPYNSTGASSYSRTQWPISEDFRLHPKPPSQILYPNPPSDRLNLSNSHSTPPLPTRPHFPSPPRPPTAETSLYTTRNPPSSTWLPDLDEISRTTSNTGSRETTLPGLFVETLPWHYSSEGNPHAASGLFPPLPTRPPKTSQQPVQIQPVVNQIPGPIPAPTELSTKSTPLLNFPISLPLPPRPLPITPKRASQRPIPSHSPPPVIDVDAIPSDDPIPAPIEISTKSPSLLKALAGHVSPPLRSSDIPPRAANSTPTQPPSSTLPRTPVHQPHRTSHPIPAKDPPKSTPHLSRALATQGKEVVQVKDEPIDDVDFEPQRQLVTGACTRYELPDNCKKSCPEFKEHRREFVKTKVRLLKGKGLTIVKQPLFREDGMVLEWTSPRPVWSDTFLPNDLASVITSAGTPQLRALSAKDKIRRKDLNSVSPSRPATKKSNDIIVVDYPAPEGGDSEGPPITANNAVSSAALKDGVCELPEHPKPPKKKRIVRPSQKDLPTPKPPKTTFKPRPANGPRHSSATAGGDARRSKNAAADAISSGFVPGRANSNGHTKEEGRQKECKVLPTRPPMPGSRDTSGQNFPAVVPSIFRLASASQPPPSSSWTALTAHHSHTLPRPYSSSILNETQPTSHSHIPEAYLDMPLIETLSNMASSPPCVSRSLSAELEDEPVDELRSDAGFYPGDGLDGALDGDSRGHSGDLERGLHETGNVGVDRDSVEEVGGMVMVHGVDDESEADEVDPEGEAEGDEEDDMGSGIPLAQRFILRYMRTFDSDRWKLAAAYTTNAKFSVSVHDATGPAATSKSRAGWFCTPHSHDLKWQEGRADIVDRLKTLGHNYTFAHQNRKPPIYDLVFRPLECDDTHCLATDHSAYKKSRSKRRPKEVILLTVHGNMVDSQSTSDYITGGTGVHVISVDQSFVLCKPHDFSCWGGDWSEKEDVEPWPLVALSHQMVVRDQPMLSPDEVEKVAPWISRILDL